MRLEVRGAYPPDWREIATRTKDEAGGRCIRCHHPDDRPGRLQPCDELCTHAPDPVKQRMLTVHHLDGDKSNCRWWNLLPLCQACHLSVQARVIPARMWILDHSTWFIPYVCGFYAFHYGRLEITREQADTIPNYYLGLGQPWRNLEYASSEARS